jgi:hypothetical protein
MTTHLHLVPTSRGRGDTRPQHRNFTFTFTFTTTFLFEQFINRLRISQRYGQEVSCSGMWCCSSRRFETSFCLYLQWSAVHEKRTALPLKIEATWRSSKCRELQRHIPEDLNPQFIHDRSPTPTTKAAGSTEMSGHITKLHGIISHSHRLDSLANHNL